MADSERELGSPTEATQPLSPLDYAHMATIKISCSGSNLTPHRPRIVGRMIYDYVGDVEADPALQTSFVTLYGSWVLTEGDFMPEGTHSNWNWDCPSCSLHVYASNEAIPFVDAWNDYANAPRRGWWRERPCRHGHAGRYDYSQKIELSAIAANLRRTSK